MGILCSAGARTALLLGGSGWGVPNFPESNSKATGWPAIPGKQGPGGKVRAFSQGSPAGSGQRHHEHCAKSKDDDQQ
jgi:hypothetical protein